MSFTYLWAPRDIHDLAVERAEPGLKRVRQGRVVDTVGAQHCRAQNTVGIHAFRQFLAQHARRGSQAKPWRFAIYVSIVACTSSGESSSISLSSSTGRSC